MLSNSKAQTAKRGAFSACVSTCTFPWWYVRPSMKIITVFFAWLGLVSAFVLPHVPGPRLAVWRASSTSSTSSSEDVQFRRALDKEEGTIRRILAGMLMNPLSIKLQNFICAEDEGALVGFGQVRAIGGGEYELASLHVAESHRKRGIGSNLVRQLIEGFVATHGPEQLQNVYLLTLADTANFYEKLGFEVVAPADAPGVLKAESAVGSFIQSFFGNSLVCMRATSE